MEHLINIDNEGTLTDICVSTGSNVNYTKTLTTPADLSECFFEGITKASEVIYGEKNLPQLLKDTQLIRYSSTQGTNALVERKGPGIGLITDDPALVGQLTFDDATTALFDDLVGDRVEVLDQTNDPEALDIAFTGALSSLTTAGAERLIVAIGDPAQEKAYKSLMLKRFPRHLLGSVPVRVNSSSRSWRDDVDDQSQINIQPVASPTVKKRSYG